MAIDEKKLKDDVWKYALTCKNTSFEFARRMSDIEKIIDAQPKILLENKTSDNDVPDTKVGMMWIPVTKRLPKKLGWYRVTLKSMVDGHRCTDLASYNPNLGFFWRAGVVAWMEEPEPYKGGENDE